MNTRIQVEHPVTEAITGIDLVRETLRIADGEPLRFAQHDITMRGAALECRINAEDPLQDFRPNPGRIDELVWPTGPGVRIDSLLYPGYVVPPFYDSLLAKLIVHDEHRAAALRRMTRALGELHVGGLKTTAPLHVALLADDDGAPGAITRISSRRGCRDGATPPPPPPPRSNTQPTMQTPCASGRRCDDPLYVRRRRVRVRRNQRIDVARRVLQGHGDHA